MKYSYKITLLSIFLNLIFIQTHAHQSWKEVGTSTEVLDPYNEDDLKIIQSAFNDNTISPWQVSTANMHVVLFKFIGKHSCPLDDERLLRGKQQSISGCLKQNEEGYGSCLGRGNSPVNTSKFPKDDPCEND